MMATDTKTLAEATISLPEFARFIGRHVVTVRKWFDNDKAVIRTPRGGQRDQILIPISHALMRCKEMNIPEELQKPLLEHHKSRSEKAASVTSKPTKVKKKVKVTGKTRVPAGR